MHLTSPQGIQAMTQNDSNTVRQSFWLMTKWNCKYEKVNNSYFTINESKTYAVKWKESNLDNFISTYWNDIWDNLSVEHLTVYCYWGHILTNLLSWPGLCFLFIPWKLMVNTHLSFLFTKKHDKEKSYQFLEYILYYFHVMTTASYRVVMRWKLQLYWNLNGLERSDGLRR